MYLKSIINVLQIEIHLFILRYIKEVVVFMKIARSYRLNEEAIQKFEKIVEFYNEYQKNFAADLPSIGKKASQADVLEFMINHHYKELKETYSDFEDEKEDRE